MVKTKVWPGTVTQSQCVIDVLLRMACIVDRHKYAPITTCIALVYAFLPQMLPCRRTFRLFQLLPRRQAQGFGMSRTSLCCLGAISGQPLPGHRSCCLSLHWQYACLPCSATSSSDVVHQEKLSVGYPSACYKRGAQFVNWPDIMLESIAGQVCAHLPHWRRCSPCR